MTRPFLTACWTNLIMLTYRLDPAMLQPFVPPGCELDTIDGDAFVSLVAFDFSQTRVFGIAWPLFTTFPEINLRFYVRHQSDRGVCFIREYVQQKTIATLANWLYNEPYKTARLKSELTKNTGMIRVQHALTIDNLTNTVSVAASSEAFCPEPNSLESFLKDQQWGLGQRRSGRLIRYKVTHPLWKIHPVKSFSLDWNWTSVYGRHWAELQEMEPASVMLVKGSPIKLFPYGTMPTEPANARRLAEMTSS